ILGMNLTQVDGDEVYGFRKIGLNVGAGVMVPVAKNWDVSMEVLYNQKGANQSAQYNDSLYNGAYRVKLNYMDIPVLVMYTDKGFISAGGGFSWGRLVGVKEWEQGKFMETTTLESGVYSKNDFSILGDLRIRVYKQLKFNLRYQYTMFSIRTREFENLAGEKWTRNQFNSVISFRLIWVFNEEQSKRIIDEK
ncbi:MAG: PorT family protein, partial [Bacteroidales bacterium]|nr:PorT family protein [Bacteroidales bacterium]